MVVFIISLTTLLIFLYEKVFVYCTCIMNLNLNRTFIPFFAGVSLLAIRQSWSLSASLWSEKTTFISCSKPHLLLQTCMAYRFRVSITNTNRFIYYTIGPLY